MSDDYNHGQPYPTGSQFGAQGAAAEMESILERVKDERLRLLRLLKDCEIRFGSGGVVPPAEEVARLTGKVRAIDDAVKNRYAQLRHDESDLEKRAYQIDQLRECIQGLADQITSQIEQAKSIGPDLAAARSAVKGEADRVILDARSELAQLGDALTGRLAEYRNAQEVGREQLSETRREIERAFKDIDERLASAAGAARDEAQKLIDPLFGQLENHATDCGLRVQEMIRAADDAVREKLDALPDKALAALEPARQTLNEVIEDARAQIVLVNEVIAAVEGRVCDLPARADGVLQERLDAIANRAGRIMDEMVAERQATFAQRIEEQDKALARKLDEALRDKQAQMIVALDEQAEAITKRLLLQQEERIGKLVRERVEQAAAELAKRFESVTAEAGDRAQASIEQMQQKMRKRIQELCASSQGMVELIEQQLTRKLKGVEPQACQAIESIEKQVGERLSKLRDNAQSMAQVVEDQLSKRVAELQPNAVNAARDAERELNEHLDRVRQEVDNVIAPLRRQVIEELGQIADVGKSIRGAARGGDAGTTEPPVIDARKLSTPLHEMANRVGKKAAKLIGSHHDDPATDNDADRQAA